jgi:hypothetical protein
MYYREKSWRVLHSTVSLAKRASSCWSRVPRPYWELHLEAGHNIRGQAAESSI